MTIREFTSAKIKLDIHVMYVLRRDDQYVLFVKLENSIVNVSCANLEVMLLFLDMALPQFRNEHYFILKQCFKLGDFFQIYPSAVDNKSDIE